MLLAVAACTIGGAEPTDIVIYTTATPPPATPVIVSLPATETPTDTPTLEPSPSELASESAPASPSPAVSASASASAAASPTGPAGGCTGSVGNQAFFADAANKLTFAVYCAVLPKGWYLGSANYEQPSGGKLLASYKGPNGASFAISEGAFCTGGASACAPKSSTLGTGSFDGMSGELDAISGGYAVYVDPGTTKAYQATGSGMTQATFAAYAAAVVKVPKS
jgi:hypothetical protein